ncbi:MAG: membrane protein insertase YidC, partial [Armatimonadetes bacterium]|nr:membrane protein insertase YidC [Armatimonadota bacterium]
MLRSKPTLTFTTALRFFPLFVVLMAVGMPASAQNPQFDSRFAKAQRDAASNELDRAFDAYISVKNHSGTNGPVQADALLRAALMAWNALHADNYQVTLRQIGGTEKEDELTGLGYKADGVLNQLLSTYSDSPEADQARQHIYGAAGNVDLRRAIENEIDLRNSRYISYKLLNSVVSLTGSLPGFSYWFALVLIALAVKAITFPFYLKSYASQREMRRIQPIIADLQKRMKGSKDLNMKIMETYKEHGVNPMAGCIPMLIPLPLTWWVYSVIRLYQFHFANGTFLWIGSALSHHMPNVLATNLATFDYPILILYA